MNRTAGKKKKLPRKKPLDKERILDECAQRMASSKERETFRKFLGELVENNALPIELLQEIPRKPEEIGKTRFDQLYDTCMSLVFPTYRPETLTKLLASEDLEGLETVKIWRVMFPPKFKLSHILLRASSFQEAYALACDYVCRVSLKAEGKIPTDLTIRVQFVSERAVRRSLDMRWANRVKKRKELQLVGREFSSKEISGARLAALGEPGTNKHSLFKYAEIRDLRKIKKAAGKMRQSAVETEVFRSK
jgi:hypothetical protein